MITSNWETSLPPHRLPPQMILNPQEGARQNQELGNLSQS